jgi:hypothetical protein
MSGFPWTEEQIAQFRELYAQGLSHREIGAILGISRNACIGKKTRLGLPPRQETQGKRPRKSGSPLYRRIWNGRHGIERAPIGREAIELPIEPTTALVEFSALEPHHCRWPVSGEKARMLYCGAVCLPGQIFYCAWHYAKAYARVPTRGVQRSRPRR